MLKRSLKDRAVSYRPNDADATHLEAVLSLGDRRVADAVERAWQMGQVFDAWDEYLSLPRWQQALAEAGIDPAFFANRQKDLSEPLPWDHIQCGVSKAYLRAEYKRACEARPTKDCHTDPCTFCNACDRAYTESGKAKREHIAFVPNALPLLPVSRR